MKYLNKLTLSIAAIVLMLAACGEKAAKKDVHVTQSSSESHAHDHAEPAGQDEHDHAEAEYEAVSISFAEEQQAKIDFATTAVVKGLVRTSVSATGTIKAQPDGEALLTAQMAGLVRSAGTFPKVGQAVKSGQVLAYFVPRLGGETDHATLEAAVTKARIAADQAKRQRERIESLFKDEAVAEKRLHEARADESIATAELMAAQQRLGQLGNNSGGIALRAPIGGVIADVSVTPGAFVTEGSPLIHIANTRKLWLEARVPESDVARLGTPSGAWFSVDGANKSIAINAGKNGKLIAVGSVVDTATRTVPVIFEFANSTRNLPLGMTVKVQLFAGDSHEGMLIPASAVQDENGTNVVYVQTGDESFERVIVQLGARDGERVEIKSGLEVGEGVVSKGAYLIRLSGSKNEPVGHAH